MQALDNAIQHLRAAVEEAEWRQAIQDIINLILAELGFPVPPNQPNPATCTHQQALDYGDAVEEAAEGYEWPGDN